MSEAIAILAGIGLAAACGFRVFLPLFLASLAVQTGLDGFGGFELRSLVGGDHAWLGTPASTLALGVATLLEIGAYYIPWLDNALDVLATPSSAVAGTLAAFVCFPASGGEAYLDWILAAIAGGGVAGVIQAGTATVRGASTATTAGLGNFVVATGELVGSLVTSLLALLAPVIAGSVALLLALWLGVRLLRLFFRRGRKEPV